MYLIDTNIFLEILLGQEKSEECENLLKNIEKSNIKFFVSSFTMHSIEVILERNNKINELTEFLKDLSQSKIIRLDSTTQDELESINAMNEQKLDFDDALQFQMCKKHSLTIISYDRHFDKTKIKRTEPSKIKI